MAHDTDQSWHDRVENLRLVLDRSRGWVGTFEDRRDRAIRAGASAAQLRLLDREVAASRLQVLQNSARLAIALRTRTHEEYLDACLAAGL